MRIIVCFIHYFHSKNSLFIKGFDEKLFLLNGRLGLQGVGEFQRGFTVYSPNISGT